MKKYFLVFLLMFSCGNDFPDDIIFTEKGDDKDTENKIETVIDPEFKPHVDSFSKIVGTTVKNSVVMGKLKDGIAGTCYYHWSFNRDRNRIVIDKEYYNLIKKSYYSVEQLIWHELGHCFLKIWTHDDKIMEKKISDELMGEYTIDCPKSIMNSTAFSAFEMKHCYIPFKKHYINDLFIEKGELEKIND